MTSFNYILRLHFVTAIFTLTACGYKEQAARDSNKKTEPIIYSQNQTLDLEWRSTSSDNDLQLSTQSDITLVHELEIENVRVDGMLLQATDAFVQGTTITYVTNVQGQAFGASVTSIDISSIDNPQVLYHFTTNESDFNTLFASSDSLMAFGSSRSHGPTAFSVNVGSSGVYTNERMIAVDMNGYTITSVYDKGDRVILSTGIEGQLAEWDYGLSNKLKYE